ncbi:thiolase family protein [Leifsonia sp. A12D58]|uniref:thiolase family protein n=1 Tax=Leifsonia sp. A12D58 TaxID=3397674 RepID=UPI0039E0193B
MSDPLAEDGSGIESRVDLRRIPVVILGRRTAFGRKNGSLRSVRAEHLLAPVLRALVDDSGIQADEIDDVIIGNAVGGGGNVARLAALDGGLPVSVPGLTIDRQCGSGLEAIVLACRLIAAGAGSLYLAGGVDSCSTAPLRAHRLSSTPEQPDFYTRAQFSPDSIGDPDMGVAAENVAARYLIDRDRQDRFAAQSHRRSLAARAAGEFDTEIVPIQTGQALVETDEGPRASLVEATLRRFPPVFAAHGTVTAGNSCADADGAVAVIVTSLAKAREVGFTRSLRFVDSAAAGVNPHYLGVAGAVATAELLERTEITAGDLARTEYTEAFAAQVLASCDLMGLDENDINLQGGALAVGHPFGASGALLVLRLLQQSAATGADGDLGLAALSIAGGLGVSSLWQWGES